MSWVSCRCRRCRLALVAVVADELDPLLRRALARAVEQITGDKAASNADVDLYGPVTSGWYGSPNGWYHENRTCGTMVLFGPTGIRVDIHVNGMGGV